MRWEGEPSSGMCPNGTKMGTPVCSCLSDDKVSMGRVTSGAEFGHP